MAISSAFKSAYTNKVTQQNQGISTIASGVKDAATLALGVAGFAGGLGQGAIAGAAKHALAGRVGGIGGNIMLSTLEEKKGTAQANQQTQSLYTGEQVLGAIDTDNPINRTAVKQLTTVFEQLQLAQQAEVLNKKGNLDTSFGEVDPSTELGKKILGEISDADKR